MSNYQFMADNAIDCVAKAFQKKDLSDDVFDSFGNEIVDVSIFTLLSGKATLVEHMNYKEESDYKHSFYAYMICQDITGNKTLVEGTFFVEYELDRKFIRLKFDKNKETKI